MRQAGGWLMAIVILFAVTGVSAPSGIGAELQSTNVEACRTSELQPVSSTNVGQMPVIFVHGIGGSPQIFFSPEQGSDQTLVSQVEQLGDVSPWTFNYSAESLDWVTNTSIGPALAAGIDCLASATGSQVALIDHSMGGLASQLAASQPDRSGGSTAQHIAEVITVGTPFLGSAFLKIVQELISGANLTLDSPLVAAADALLSACAGVANLTLQLGDGNICGLLAVPRSPVGTALEYGSRQIAALPAWPSWVPVYDVAGNILWQIGWGFLSVTVGLGDVLVSVGSATAHDTLGSPSIVTCHTANLHVLGTLCYHGHLLRDPQVDGDVVSSLKDVVASTSSVPSAGSVGPLITRWGGRDGFYSTSGIVHQDGNYWFALAHEVSSGGNAVNIYRWIHSTWVSEADIPLENRGGYLASGYLNSADQITTANLSGSADPDFLVHSAGADTNWLNVVSDENSLNWRAVTFDDSDGPTIGEDVTGVAGTTVTVGYDNCLPDCAGGTVTKVGFHYLAGAFVPVDSPRSCTGEALAQAAHQWELVSGDSNVGQNDISGFACDSGYAAAAVSTAADGGYGWAISFQDQASGWKVLSSGNLLTSNGMPSSVFDLLESEMRGNRQAAFFPF